MDVFIRPGQLEGAVTPPPSKSIAHRALILAALAEGIQGMDKVQGVSRATSQDVRTTMECLEKLMEANQDVVELDSGESGSTLRFLIPVAAALGKSVKFTGQGRLPYRPLREYVEILEPHGVTLKFAGELNLPVLVSGQLKSGTIKLPGHISSQYITGLMLALPLLADESRIILTTPLQSAPYVNITREMLAQFGVVVNPLIAEDGTVEGWIIPAGQKYTMPEGGVRVEADYSQAAFWLVAKFMGHNLEVHGLNPTSTQGDRGVISILEKMKSWPAGFAGEVDAQHIPDLVPILAVAATRRAGKTVLKNVARLRLKESDRLATTSEVLGELGASISVQGDCLVVEGGDQLEGGKVSSHGDHRIAMAAAIAALCTKRGVLIEGAEAVAKSYPNFFQELQRLGGEINGI